MNQPFAVRDRIQSLGEEIANSITHGIGLLAAIIAAPLLILAAVQRGDTSSLIGAIIFASTMVLMYLASTVYHALPNNRAKEIFRLLDHGAIYLLIAGTYTPFTLGVLYGAWGFTLLGLEWTLAIVGFVLKVFGKIRHPKLSTGIYLAMGWLALIAIRPFWQRMPLWGAFWLLAGGLAYTMGVGFFAAKRLRYAHSIWHLFVIAGTACHAIAVFAYAG